MQDCIFCKIVKKELPCHKVYEDHDFLGFLDIRPLTKGNTLIIPKKHFRWVDDVPNLGDYFKAAGKVGIAAKKMFDADWVCYLTLGLEVPHAHIRVIPRYKNDLHGVIVDLEKIEDISKQEMEKIAEQLFSEVKNN